VRNFVRECLIYERYKADLFAPGGLLQPLPTLGPIGVDVSLDFIEDLPKLRGKDTILVVVDRLSKYTHFLPLSHPFFAMTIAQLYFDNVFKLHGVSKIIVSDRDRVFISQFWQEFLGFSTQPCISPPLTILRVLAKLKWLMEAWRAT